LREKPVEELENLNRTRKFKHLYPKKGFNAEALRAQVKAGEFAPDENTILCV
jgi:hypothetical protein